MPNVLVVPVSGSIFFDRNVAGASTVAALNSAVRLSYDEGGGLNITSYTAATTALDRFTIDGAQGRLFSVTDVLTGSLFSVNDITGLPILEVLDTDTVVAGAYNTNTLIVSGTRIAVGRTIDSTAKVAISGNITVSGTLSTNNLIVALGGNSNQWNSNYATTQSNSANWSGAYTSFNANSSFYDAAVNELFTYLITETGDEFITQDDLLMVNSNIDGYPAWNSATETVYSLSAGWENTGNILTSIGWTNSQAASADAIKWRSTYTSVCANSANWSSAYTTLCAISAFVTFRISKTITLAEFPNGYTFSDADNGNIYHVDTTTSSVSVLVPSNLSNNFNVTLVTLGTNTMHISSTQVPILCATGSKVRLPFSSTLLYKYNNFVWGLGSLA